MRKIGVILLVLVALGGLIWVIQVGVQPRAIPKIKLSEFSDPESVGQAVGKRLWLELRESPFLLLGVQPGEPLHIAAVRGLIGSLPDEVKYHVLMAEPQLPGVEGVGAFQAVDVNANTEIVANFISSALASGIRVAVVVPSVYSSQLLGGNPVSRMKTLGLSPLSLSFVGFPRSREEEKVFEIPCVTGHDSTGVGPLGCAIIQRARVYYRKMKPGVLQGFVDQFGERDYLVGVR